MAARRRGGAVARWRGAEIAGPQMARIVATARDAAANYRFLHTSRRLTEIFCSLRAKNLREGSRIPLEAHLT